MQNMKVDIVYYMVPADFEMEFNLSGCCPMRQLKTLTHSKREYIEGLSRAVSRSKIILACGSIYGEDGLIEMTAKATHRPTEIIDNSEYGIAQDLNVEIIEGSVPLVTSSGLFGGVIIESGPQTIIILSDNKDIRKNIMKNLIHGYVRDVSILEIKRNSGAAVLDAVPAESSNGERAEETAKEIFESAGENGEVIDFSEQETAQDAEISAAPSDEALKAVAEEINDLSSKIGEALNEHADGRTAEEADGAAEETEEQAEEPAEKQPETDGFLFADEESSENYVIELGDEDIEDNRSELPVKEDETQIDFSIDSEADSEEEPGENDYLKAPAKDTVSVPDFLFEEGETPDRETENKQETEEKEKEDLNDYSFIATDDDYVIENRKKKRGGLLNRSLLVISIILVIILLVLCYFVVYLPMQSGISPMEYINSLFTGSVRLIFGRG